MSAQKTLKGVFFEIWKNVKKLFLNTGLQDPQIQSLPTFVRHKNTHRYAETEKSLVRFVSHSIRYARPSDFAVSPNFTKYSVHILCGRGSILRWWRL